MFRVFPYTLPLHRPLDLARGIRITERKGVLIHNPECDGWGDAAPLPGFSQESLDEVLEVLQMQNPDTHAFPSLRFACECASERFRIPEKPVPVNALWIMSAETPSAFLNRIEKWRHPVAKIKPGAQPDPDAICEVLLQRPDLRIRLDGNRQWSVEQTLELHRRIPASCLEYFEEPLRDPEDYSRLWAREEVPLALDESLLLPEGRRLAEHPSVKALILKPTLLGDSGDRAAWIEMAEVRSLKLVWSSCFESGVGLWQLANLASSTTAAGLDTGGIFVRDVVEPRPLSVCGSLSASVPKVKISGS
ncbi:MAG: enolase C-terminal domain-like protein [Kiritimatiellia bacterium]